MCEVEITVHDIHGWIISVLQIQGNDGTLRILRQADFYSCREYGLHRAREFFCTTNAVSCVRHKNWRSVHDSFCRRTEEPTGTTRCRDPEPRRRRARDLRT